MKIAAKKENDIVITGVGAITALGQGVKSLQIGLKEGRRNFAFNPNFTELSFPVISAALENFDFEHAINTYIDINDDLKRSILKAGRRAPLTIQTSLIAALEAYLQARLNKRSISRQRIGLVIAGQNTTQRYLYESYKQFQNIPDYLSPAYALRFMDTDQVGTLSEVFDIQGEGFTVGGASATGNIGIIQAYRLLQQELIDVCLVVGVLADLSPLEIQSFYNLGAMAGKHYVNEPLQACRPFDQQHEGFIWGQASGCIVLETRENAQRDEIVILAGIKGVAMALDAHRQAEPNVNGESRVMRQALLNAKLAPEMIQYINTHGSSSILGDETELLAIHDVFKHAVDQIWINSSKGLLGHCLWSAGVIEAIATIIQMQFSFVHPNANLDNPIDNSFRWAGITAQQADIYYALSNSFGFGGINSGIVFSRES